MLEELIKTIKTGLTIAGIFGLPLLIIYRLFGIKITQQSIWWAVKDGFILGLCIISYTLLRGVLLMAQHGTASDSSGFIIWITKVINLFSILVEFLILLPFEFIFGVK